MKNTMKKMNLIITKKSSFIKKFTTLLYIIFAIMSMSCHQINTIGNLVSEIVIYFIIYAMITIIPKTIDINDIKALFE